jgi:hypothetical protein
LPGDAAMARGKARKNRGRAERATTNGESNVDEVM